MTLTCPQCAAEVLLPFAVLAYSCTCPFCYGLCWLSLREPSDESTLITEPGGKGRPN